ncbi:MAG: hypothetical protein ACJ763_07735 [Bdellovibrionia bacterium]
MKPFRDMKAAAFLMSLFASLALSACNAEVTGPDGTIPSIDWGGGGGGHTSDFEHLISGPSIDGTWKSKCVEDKRQNKRWDLITLTVSGQSVTRLNRWFNDENCTQSAGEKNEIGRFRYLRNNTRGDFEVEYAFKMQNGTYTQYETFNLKGQTLYISNEIGGEGAADVPLLRDGGGNNPSPTPAPTPAPTPTQVPDGKSHAATYGDEIHFVGKSLYGTQNETYTNQGYDSSYKTWTVFYKIEPGTSMGYDYYRTLWSTAQANEYLNNCAGHAGTLETVTVPAGTFQTCKVVNSKSIIWYGNVPIFGYVKVAFRDGSYTGELKSYFWGDSLGSGLFHF